MERIVSLEAMPGANRTSATSLLVGLETGDGMARVLPASMWSSESSKVGAPGWTTSGEPVRLASFLRILASLPLVGWQRSDAR